MNEIDEESKEYQEGWKDGFFFCSKLVREYMESNEKHFKDIIDIINKNFEDRS